MKSRVKAKPRGKSKRVAPAKTTRVAGRKSSKPRKVAKPARTAAPKADPLDSWIIAGVQGLGLKAEKSWMTAIRTNLRVTLEQGVMVAEYPLSDHDEPAPVFRA
jgi:hypothetical protein